MFTVRRSVTYIPHKAFYNRYDYLQFPKEESKTQRSKPLEQIHMKIELACHPLLLTPS